MLRLLILLEHAIFMACSHLITVSMNKTFRFIVGVVFLLSGLLKTANTAAFADLMSSYGITWFGYAAPVIILVEIILSVLLIFNIKSQLNAIMATVFLCAVTTIFAYGFIVKGITDCGCFGPLTWLNSKPWLTFTRNGILLAMLLPSLFSMDESASPTISSVIFMAVIAVVVMFMCGFSFRGAKCLTRHQSFQPIPLTDSPLDKFVDCHPDSLYIVFAFSYGCPYCQNSIGNVNQYVPMGVVDRVIALAVEDSVARERFNRLFQVDFDIREISPVEMVQLTTTLPTTYLIRHDSIINSYSGMLISPALYLP